MEESSSPSSTNSDEIAFDIADLTQGTAIEDQRCFRIVFTELRSVGGRGTRAQLDGFLLQSMKKNVEVQCHVSENRLIHLLNHWNALHGQQTMKELKDILNQLKRRG